MNNDLLILNETLSSLKVERLPSYSEDDFFEFFSADQILKQLDPTSEQICNGITDNGNDGGIDSIYISYNGEIIELDEIDQLKIKENSEIRLIAIQSKNKESYQDTPILRTIDAFKKLLELTTSQEHYHIEFNEKIRERFEIFRKLYKKAAPRFPSLKIEYHYATKGISNEIHPNVINKIFTLQEIVTDLFSNAEFSHKIWGAKELLEQARKRPTTSLVLKLTETPIGTESGDNFIGISKLSDYYNFITDEEGRLRKWMFETNVRDYQGDVIVNKSIRETLENDIDANDFWWLNNGVTILASKASVSSKTMHIANPEIVNGLQTSNVIYFFYKSNPSKKDSESRCILIRVIAATNEETRDKIIRATNSQTAIPQSSLRATDPIHRDIEDHLRSYGLFYDRRKNYYKNQGKPIEKIVSLQYLAQGLMAILLQQPNYARARPSTLLNNEDEYVKLFTCDYPITTYGQIAVIITRIEHYLRSKAEIDASLRNNLRFYVALDCVIRILRKTLPTANDVSIMNLDLLSDKLIHDSLYQISDKYNRLGGTDKIAKGNELIDWIKNGKKDAAPINSSLESLNS
jgi:hypothetical protein